MRRSTAAMLACVALGGVGPACLFPSLSSLSGTDAASDVASPDAAADSADARAEACTGFCDNFDDRLTVVGAWTELYTAGSGATANATITTTEFVSSPRAVHFLSPAQSSSPSSGNGVQLTITLPIKSSKMTLDLDVKIVGDVGGMNGYVNILSLGADGRYTGGFTAEDGYYAFDYYVALADGGINHVITSTAVSDAGWHHVHYEEVFDPVAGSVLATYDGVPVINDTGVPTYIYATPTQLNLGIGTLAQNTTVALDVYCDNVQAQ